MLNQCILVGRLVRNAELNVGTNGRARSKFTLAINRNYKNEKGEVPVDFY